ncbi:acyl-CoA thioesterase [Benzoatithermus flavus]|uniref:Thioesterase family protein n=1 Tax=Benzoatithermus flavus TaxID=3108223 RepID=A0ABU8XWB7_9PROT
MASDTATAPFRSRRLVRLADCDPVGVVYFPRYFDLFHGLIEDWFGQGLGLDYWRLLREDGLAFPVAHAEADYRASSRMGETLDLELRIERLGERSLTLRIDVSGAVDGAVRVKGRLVTVATDLASGRSVPIPEDLRAVFRRYVGRCGREVA